MRRLASCAIAAALLWSLALSGPRLADAAPSPAPKAPAITLPLPPHTLFLHTTGEGNLSGTATRLTNPATDNLPLELIFATHNYNPGGVGGQYANRAVGAYYAAPLSQAPSGFVGQWWLYNEDSAVFDGGLAYNILAAPPNERTFTHTTNVTNTAGNSTTLDHVWLNGRLDRIPFIMHNLTPVGVGSGSQITPALGIWYDTNSLLWGIFAQDGSSLPLGDTFNIIVGLPGENVFTHTATISNTFFNYTLLDHPLANGNPNALVLVTQSWNPDGAETGVNNNQHVGVYYQPDIGRWAIYNENSGVDMPLGASFSVLVDGVQLHLPAILLN